MPTSTRDTSRRPASGERSALKCASVARRCLSAAVLAFIAPFSGNGLAQELLDETPSTPLERGHSAAYFGIEKEMEQRASIRAVLSSVELDRVRQAPSLLAVGSYTLLLMFMGGADVPVDLAKPRKDVADVFRGE